MKCITSLHANPFSEKNNPQYPLDIRFLVPNVRSGGFGWKKHFFRCTKKNSNIISSDPCRRNHYTIDILQLPYA